jgi:hypothetical protein
MDCCWLQVADKLAAVEVEKGDYSARAIGHRVRNAITKGVR